MLKAGRRDLDYFQLVKRAGRLVPDPAWRKLRVALLADCSTGQLVPLLRALFARAGVDVVLHEGAYDAFEIEALDAGSPLYRFAPDIVVLLHATAKLKARFLARTDREGFADARAAEMVHIWDAVRAHSGATVLQTTFVLPYERPHGSYGLKLPNTLQGATRDVNRALVAAARERAWLLLCDLDEIAGWVGRRSWYDEKLWLLSKTICALEHLPLVAQDVVDVALSTLGAGVKCVVTDLDNTLWGGTVGDDGMEGLRLGELDDGPAFVALQRYLLELRRRGILLAVCSKNDPELALRAFREHPDMVLREDDIAVFLANWDDKATNIARIRQTLNIGLDSMVFLDDNPFERNLVRELLPEVIVPELPEDPADYVKAISELNLFETRDGSSLDAQRTQLYREQASRDDALRRHGDVDGYLRSLDARAALGRFDAFHLPRIAQLTARSNQFNLTTRRYDQAQCEALMRDEARVVPIHVSLRDRVGDFGLILVAVLRIEGTTAVVDQFLMSCRVLQRGVEQFAMNYLVEEARARGAQQMVGRYLPTAKNGMVAGFYADFGFTKVEEDARGNTTWALALDTYAPRDVHVRAEAPEGGSHG